MISTLFTPEEIFARWKMKAQSNKDMLVGYSDYIEEMKDIDESPMSFDEFLLFQFNI